MDNTKYMDIKPFVLVPNIFGMEMSWLNQVTKEGWMRQHKYTLVNIKYGRKIPVAYESVDLPLGTTDGQSYHLNPARDEAINDWTEKH